ncbi:MAG: Sll0314/Alr1548 family TPR repeat-containing protein [Pseudanabaenaceae cyanobacterium bins.68]|nr:Sll0314/Alr1548 family TPR repeat-containing protein [Pseudanabaenaceae cyanobacterium bins.68]
MKFLASTLTTLALALTLASSPARAGDPFRTTNPRPISADTQAAFELMFKQGDYPSASKQLDRALRSDPSEPLAQSLKASLAYIEQDFQGMLIYARRTRDRAEQLKAKDKLRGHLYSGVGYLIEAGHAVSTQGLFSGTAQALGLVQKVLDEIKSAQAVNDQDPELNLIKGYMDMLIASVLPLADLEGALGSLRRSGPAYLKYRGIALGYRDAKRATEALEAVDQAIAAAPENPELLYLKGQILWQKGDNLDLAKQFYIQALAKAKQIPPNTLRQINSECTTLAGNDCLVSPPQAVK